MRIRRRALLGAAAGTAVALIAGPVPATAGATPADDLIHGFVLKGSRFVSVDVPGAEATLPKGISASGRIVGHYGPLAGPHDGFVRDKLGTRFITVPGAFGTFPVDVNDRQIIGIYNTLPDFEAHGFVLEGGQFTTIDPPGSVGTLLNGINGDGDMVGSFVDATGIQHGFIRRGGQFKTVDFPEPGTTVTALQAINDVGVISGAFRVASGPAHPFLLKDGVFTRFEVPGAISPIPDGINNHGTVVGYYRDEARVVHGFIYREGQAVTVDAPGALNTELFGINDDNLIVGSFDNIPWDARPAWAARAFSPGL